MGRPHFCMTSSSFAEELLSFLWCVCVFFIPLLSIKLLYIMGLFQEFLPSSFGLGLVLWMMLSWLLQSCNESWSQSWCFLVLRRSVPRLFWPCRFLFASIWILGCCFSYVCEECLWYCHEDCIGSRNCFSIMFPFIKYSRYWPFKERRLISAEHFNLGLDDTFAFYLWQSSTSWWKM